MKRGSFGVALFTGAIVALVVFLSEYIIPDSNLITSVSIAGVSALTGGLLANKLISK